MSPHPLSDVERFVAAAATAPTPRAAPRHRALVVSALIIAGIMAIWITCLGVVAQRQHSVRALLESMNGGQVSERLDARTRLLDDPNRTAPVLVSVIRQSKNRLHADVIPWLDDIPWIATRRDRQLRHERHAIDVLQRMGTDAAPAIVPLLSENRYGGRDTAIALLRAYGPDVIPLLNQTLTDPRHSLRAGAALTLGRFASATLGSLAALGRAARDPHPDVRIAALSSLSQMLDRPSEVVPTLIEALQDPVPTVQAHAAAQLRAFGPQAHPAIPGLRTCLGADADPVRVEAALTLMHIGRAEARAARSELLLALRHRDGPSSRQAAATLLHLNLHQEEALARLRGFLSHRDPQIRSRTLEIIRGLGATAEPLVPAIVALLEDREDRDNRAAVLALRSIQPSAIPDRFRTGRRNP